MNFLKNSLGITLIETVVGILLIGIILISFSGLFLSSKKVGKASEEIINGTYIAQHELESIYNFSKSKKVEDYITSNPPKYCTTHSSDFITVKITENNVKKDKPNTKRHTCTRNLDGHPYITDPSQYEIIIEFIQNKDQALDTFNYYNVIVTVNEKGKSKATMEGLYPFTP